MSNKPYMDQMEDEPSVQNRQKKNSLSECVFVNSALKIQCHIVKNTLLHTAFSAILPTAKSKIKKVCV